MAVQIISSLPIVPPPIENQTVSMIDRLEGLIQERLPHDIQKKYSTPKLDLKQEFQYERTINPLRRDTNFNEQDFSKSPSYPLSSLKTVISALAELIFGFAYFPQNKSESKLILLNADHIEWKGKLNNFYTSEVQNKVNEAFTAGFKLLNERISYEKNLNLQRLILFSTAIFASITIISGRRENLFPLISLGFISMTAGTVCFFYMVKNYVTNKLRQTDFESDMRLAVENLRKDFPRTITPLTSIGSNDKR